MFHEKIPDRQLGAWLFAAMVPVALQLLGGVSWAWVACLGGIGMGIAYAIWRCSQDWPKWQSIMLFIYVSVLMGTLLPSVAQSWPVGNSDPAVPLILLALAAWSAQKGPAAAARVGAVLFWVVLGLYLAVFAAGGKAVKLNWLMPAIAAPDAVEMTIFLLPWAGASLVRSPGVPGKRGWLTLAFIMIGTLITAGVLSPLMAEGTANAFYEMSRSLELLGVARRFEALICAGATVGWFSLMSLLLALCGEYAERIFPGRGRAGVWSGAVAAALWRLCGLHIWPVFLPVTGAIFWGVIPLLTQGLGKIKKS